MGYFIALALGRNVPDRKYGSSTVKESLDYLALMTADRYRSRLIINTEGIVIYADKSVAEHHGIVWENYIRLTKKDNNQ